MSLEEGGSKQVYPAFLYRRNLRSFVRTEAECPLLPSPRQGAPRRCFIRWFWFTTDAARAPVVEAAAVKKKAAQPNRKMLRTAVWLLTVFFASSVGVVAQSSTPTASFLCSARLGYYCSGSSELVCPIGAYCAGGAALNVSCNPPSACAAVGLGAQPPCYWNVVTLSGTGSASGVNGALTSATFNHPYGLAVNGSAIYVGEETGRGIRMISLDASTVSTLVSGAIFGFLGVPGLTIAPSGILYASDNINGIVRGVTAEGAMAVLASGLGQICGSALALDGLGLFVTSASTCQILYVTFIGTVSVVVGSAGMGYADGNALTAKINNPRDIAISSTTGLLYLADSFNNRIRIISPDGSTITCAGSGVAASTDGYGTAASFNSPSGIAIEPLGAFAYISDYLSSVIRQLDLRSFLVTTIAGSGSTTPFWDGIGVVATFNEPLHVRIFLAGSLIVADSRNNRIRQLTCVPCAASYYCNSGTPVLCPAGSYCPLYSINATPCAPGTYAPAAGAANCTICPMGTFSAAGASSCPLPYPSATLTQSETTTPSPAMSLSLTGTITPSASSSASVSFSMSTAASATNSISVTRTTAPTTSAALTGSGTESLTASTMTSLSTSFTATTATAATVSPVSFSTPSAATSSATKSPVPSTSMSASGSLITPMSSATSSAASSATTSSSWTSVSATPALSFVPSPPPSGTGTASSNRPALVSTPQQQITSQLSASAANSTTSDDDLASGKRDDAVAAEGTLNTAAVAGIAAGAFLLLFALLSIVVCYCCRRQPKGTSQEAQAPQDASKVDAAAQAVVSAKNPLWKKGESLLIPEKRSSLRGFFGDSRVDGGASARQGSLSARELLSEVEAKVRFAPLRANPLVNTL